MLRINLSMFVARSSVRNAAVATIAAPVISQRSYRHSPAVATKQQRKTKTFAHLRIRDGVNLTKQLAFIRTQLAQFLCIGLSKERKTHRLWRAGKAELITKAGISLVSLPFHQVGHGVARTAAVHHLSRAVVRVHDVCPRDVAEVLAPFQLLHGLADLN